MQVQSDTKEQDATHRGPPRWDGWACMDAFRRARGSKAWTLGYESFRSDRVEAHGLEVEGVWPKGLNGVLYRNGPGRHEVGGWRYAHRWDGDGLVQAYDFRGARPAHKAAYVVTEKFQRERAADKMLFSAFGTKVPGADALSSPIDQMNSANISVLALGKELLALWEPGSAYALDRETLSTKGVKTFSPKIAGLPFSAHPKVEPGGTVWNFGINPLKGELHVYRLTREGALALHRCLHMAELPPVHDFAVTERHLVFALSPLVVLEERIRAGSSFAESCIWQPQLGLRVLVVDKNTFNHREYRLPPGNVFHLGNAWEDDDGTIRFDMMRSEDPRALMAGWSIMRGEYRHLPSAFMTLVTLLPDGSARQQVMASLEGEFPTVDPSRVGRRHRAVACAARSPARSADVVAFDQVAVFDPESGRDDRFTYGDHWVVEEHLLVPDASDPHGAARWLMGTALDLTHRRTVCSVFDASDVAAGPVARVSLPYALPLGLHGTYVACNGL